MQAPYLEEEIEVEYDADWTCQAILGQVKFLGYRGVLGLGFRDRGVTYVRVIDMFFKSSW